MTDIDPDIDRAYALAAESDLLDTEPDDEGGLGDVDEHRGRGYEHDPGE